ncbi:hypothetical protein D918_08579 [Trichuris suis]|nr:hypothetical protein D918_08579 [Trichuris suis]
MKMFKCRFIFSRLHATSAAANVQLNLYDASTKETSACDPGKREIWCIGKEDFSAFRKFPVVDWVIVFVLKFS